MKRQFATYVKTQLNSTATSPMANTSEEVQSPQTPPQQHAYRTSNSSNNGSSSNIIGNNNSNSTVGKTYYYRTLSAASSSSSHTTSQSTSPTTEPLTAAASGAAGTGVGAGGGVATSGFLRRYASSGGSISTPPSPHLLAGLDRRHRSPDPPPRYNRGQSPLLLRKNLLELGGGGQTPGSPMLQRR